MNHTETISIKYQPNVLFTAKSNQGREPIDKMLSYCKDDGSAISQTWFDSLLIE